MHSKNEFNSQFLEHKFNVSGNDLNKCIKNVSEKLNIDEKDVKLGIMMSESPRYLRILSGPYIMKMYPNFFGKRLLLLGEYHDTSNVCPKHEKNYEIQNWLYDMTLITDECLDIFVEFPITFLKDNSQKCDIMKLEDYRSPLNAVKCRFNNFSSNTSRFHYGDLRYFYGADPLVMWMNDYSHIITTYKIEIIMKQFSDRRRLYNYIVRFDITKETQKYYCDYVFNLYRSVGKVPPTQKGYYQSIGKSIEKRKKKFDTQLHLDIFLEVLVSTYVKLDRYNAEISLLMDLYVLLRLFTTFNKTKGRGPKLCEDTDPENIIMYTGGAHTENYVKFIKNYAKLVPENINYTRLYEQCLIFNEPFDFFGEP